MITNVAFPQGGQLASLSQYPVSPGPLGALIFVGSLTGVDSRGRLKFFGSAAVSPTQGSQQGPVGDPSSPLATVFGTNGALSFCKAGRGDLIVVMPGHTENLSTNGVYTVPSGVSIIGTGYPGQRGKFIFTGGTATTVSVGAGGGVQFNNLHFDLTGVASVVSGFTLTVAGVQFVGCRILQSTATLKATTAITLNAGADDFVFNGCDLDATGAAGAVTNGILAGANVNRPEIVNNIIHGNYTGGCIVATTAHAMLDLFIGFNELRNTSAVAAQPVITLGNNSSGTVAYNNLFVLATTTGVGSSMLGTPTSNTLLLWSQNFGYDNVANVGAVLLPVVGAALT